MKGNIWLCTMLAFSLAQLNHVQAGTFHTIIGPDGRPLVVQKMPAPEKEKSASPQQRQPAQKTTPDLIPASKPMDVMTVDQKAELASSPAEKINAKTLAQPVEHSAVRVESSTPAAVPMILPTQSESVKVAPKPPATRVNPSASEPIIPVKRPSSERSAILEIEDEQYVSNELLEEKEFNLEGQKRFYMMPEGIVDTKLGMTRNQTVEREKGLGSSVMQALFKNNRLSEQNKPLVLAHSYYRISAEDAVEGLGQRCFQDKKISKAKEMAVEDHVNLWPRAPLKNQFDFEVVKLKQPLKNIQLQSFASRQQNPSFYWPFAVFLDEQGCVLEGAGGFKNNNAAGNYLHYAYIEGLLQVPDQSRYLLLTPLASAIDVEDQVLSNQGQLKLIAIR